MSCCSGGNFKNTGTPANQKVLKDFKKLTLLGLFKADGSRASVSNTDTIDATFVNGKLQEPDRLDRWYPVGEFTNVEMTVADTTFEDKSDGTRSKLLTGIVTFTGQLEGYSNKYIEKLNSFACNSELGVLGHTSCNDLVAYLEKGDDTKIFPIPISPQSMDSTLMFQADAQTGKIMFSFQFSRLVKLEDIYVLPNSALDYNFLSKAYKGNLDLIANSGNITDTSFQSLLIIDFDSRFELATNKVEGFTLADFDLFNVTTGLPIAITSVTETAGIYDFVFPAQTSGNVLRLRAYKNFKQLDDTLINIP